MLEAMLAKKARLGHEGTSPAQIRDTNRKCRTCIGTACGSGQAGLERNSVMKSIPSKKKDVK